MEKYKSATYWKDFKNIEEIDDKTSILSLKPEFDFSIENGALRLNDILKNEMISIYNMAGQLVKRTTANSSIDISDLQRNAIYVVKVGGQTFKFINK